MDPRTGPDPDGAGRGQHAGGDRHADPRHRQPAPTASSRRATASPKYRYTWPKLVVRPALRRGLRPDRQPDDRPPRRRRAVLRPSGRQHGVLDPGQPADRDVAGPAQRPAADARHGPEHRRPVPGADRSSSTTRKVPSSVAVASAACRWRCRGRRRSTSPTSATMATTACGAFQGGTTGQPERRRLRRGVSAAEPGPDARREHRAGRERATRRTCCGRIAGSATSTSSTTRVLGHVPLDPDVVQPPLPQRLRVRRQLHARPVVQGQHRSAAAPAARRRRHDLGARRPGAVRGAEREPRRCSGTSIKANAVWDLPECAVGRASGPRRATSLNDWQLSGVFTARLGPRPTTSSYTLPEQRREREPDRLARLRRRRSSIVGDPGSGCSSNQYAQFNTAAVTGPTLRQRRPRVGPQHPARLPGPHGRPGDWPQHPPRRRASAPVPLDAFNAFNAVIINGRNRDVIRIDSPTDLTVLNSQYLPDGSLDPTRSDAAERRLRRGDRRAGDAEHAGADPDGVLEWIS